MRVVINETHGSSPVGTRAWALCLVVEVMLDGGLELRVLGVAAVLKREPLTLCFLIDVVLDARLELRIWDVGFKLCAWALKWYWDAGFELCILTLQWYWDAGFEPCVLSLHKWLWLASRLKHGLCYLTTCFQWFFGSLQAYHFFSWCMEMLGVEKQQLSIYSCWNQICSQLFDACRYLYCSRSDKGSN